MKTIGAIICIFFISISLAAQEADDPVHQLVFWADNCQIQATREKIIKIDELSSKITELKTPVNTVWATFGQGECWALERPPSMDEATEAPTASNAVPFQIVWHSTDFKTWEEFGRLSGPNDVGAKVFIPLNNGGIFLIKNFGWHFKDQKYSPFFIAKATSGPCLSIKEDVELDLGPIYSKKAGASDDLSNFDNLVYNRKYQICKNMMFELPDSLMQFDHGFVLVSKQMGVFWQFDLDGHLKRRMQIFKLINNDDFSNIFKFERAILNCQMTPGHTLLVAARTKEAVWFKQQFFPTTPLGNGGNQIPSEIVSANIERGNDLFHDIEWYELDLEAGKVLSVTPPLDAPLTTLNLPSEAGSWFDFGRDGLPHYLKAPAKVSPEKAAIPPG